MRPVRRVGVLRRKRSDNVSSTSSPSSGAVERGKAGELSRKRPHRRSTRKGKTLMRKREQVAMKDTGELPRSRCWLRVVGIIGMTALKMGVGLLVGCLLTVGYLRHTIAESCQSIESHALDTLMQARGYERKTHGHEVPFMGSQGRLRDGRKGDTFIETWIVCESL